MSGTYTSIFGGGTISQAYPSYIQYFITNTTPIQLHWPSEFVVTANYTANIIDLIPTLDGCSLVMPDATLVSVGQASIFNNPTAFTISLYAHDGTTLIVSLAPQQLNMYI